MLTDRRRTLALLGCIIVLALAAAWVDLPTNPGIHIHAGPIDFDREIELRRGLDLQGGLQVLLEADVAAEEPVDPGAMDATRAIIEQRVNSLGVSEPLIQLSGGRRIIVELPGIEDPERAIETFGETGLLEFIDAGRAFLPAGTVVTTTEQLAATTPVPPIPITGTEQTTATPTAVITPTLPTEPAGPVYETILTGRHLTGATMGFGDLGLMEIRFQLDDEGTALFADYTRSNVGQLMCIVLDKQVVSCATINEPIPTGAVRITREGGFSPEEAEREVRELDRSRAEFVRNNFRQDINDPRAYDLIINTTYIDIEDALILVESGMKAKMKRGGSE